MSNLQQLSKENWELLEECPAYQISNLGRIKRIDTGGIVNQGKSTIRLKWLGKFMVNRQFLLNKYFPLEQSLLHPDLDNEIWKDVVGYEGLYKVSNVGRIKTVMHKVCRSNGRTQTVNEKILSFRLRGDTKKYHSVRLYNLQGDVNLSVHRLVAIAYVPNPFNLPVVNHKDNNPLNNSVSNLEWGTSAYNVQYADKVTGSFDSMKSKVVIYREGKQIKIANSIKEASEFVKGSRMCIRKVCLGKQKHHKGFTFSFISHLK